MEIRRPNQKKQVRKREFLYESKRLLAKRHQKARSLDVTILPEIS